MFPLVMTVYENEAASRRPDHYLPGETVRFRRRNPAQNHGRGLIVMEIVLVRHPTDVKVTFGSQADPAQRLSRVSD